MVTGVVGFTLLYTVLPAALLRWAAAQNAKLSGSMAIELSSLVVRLYFTYPAPQRPIFLLAAFNERDGRQVRRSHLDLCPLSNLVVEPFRRPRSG